MRSGFGWRNPKENYDLENLGADGRIMYKRICKTEDGRLRNGLICLRTGKSFGWYFYIYRAPRNAVNLLTSCGKIGFQEGFSCTKLFGKLY